MKKNNNDENLKSSLRIFFKSKYKEYYLQSIKSILKNWCNWINMTIIIMIKY